MYACNEHPLYVLCLPARFYDLASVALRSDSVLLDHLFQTHPDRQLVIIYTIQMNGTSTLRSLKAVSTEELEAGLEAIRTRRGGSSGKLLGRTAFQNWAGTYACTAESIFHAESEDQIRCLIELAKRQSRKLRAFGAGHSPSDLVCVTENDWLVNMDRLDKVTHVRG